MFFKFALSWGSEFLAAPLFLFLQSIIIKMSIITVSNVLAQKSEIKWSCLVFYQDRPPKPGPVVVDLSSVSQKA